MKAAVAAGVALSCGGGAVQANVGVARGPEASSIHYLWAEPPGEARYPLVLYLDGSGCASVTNVVGFSRPLLDRGIGALFPEKRGVRVDDDGARCRDEYLRTNDREERVRAAVTVLHEARPCLSRWDGRLAVVGASEGGAIAAAVARALGNVVAVVSLAGGGEAQAEELRALERLRPGTFPDLEAKLVEIRANPTHDKTWLGAANTYRRWASYVDYAPKDDFDQLTVPVLVLQGDRDESVPPKSADVLGGRPNVTVRHYPSLDHQWRDRLGLPHAREVVLEVARWLAATFARGPATPQTP